ncbi:hypothetical protein [Desulfobulbus propionicus]
MRAGNPVTVHDVDGCLTVADCCLFRTEFAHRLTATEWDPAAFLKGGKTVF